jgi:FMN-dependent NADH-azoreductase
MKLLHIEASPRGPLSVSSDLAGEFLSDIARRVDVEIDRLPVWDEDLPPFNGRALEAKYARLGGQPLTAEQDEAWTDIRRLVRRLACADALLISTPMWNFGVPYRLKHWFDLITQPGLTFTFDPQHGYAPVLSPRPSAVILASSGDYSSGPSWGRPDLASGYLDAALAFIGVTRPTMILAGPTAGPMDAQGAARRAAQAGLNDLAVSWAAGR